MNISKTGEINMADKKDINKATYDDLKKIHGMSDDMVNHILGYLEDHRPISSINELKNINGVNNNIIDEINKMFSVGEEKESAA